MGLEPRSKSIKGLSRRWSHIVSSCRNTNPWPLKLSHTLEARLLQLAHHHYVPPTPSQLLSPHSPYPPEFQFLPFLALNSHTKRTKHKISAIFHVMSCFSVIMSNTKNTQVLILCVISTCFERHLAFCVTDICFCFFISILNTVFTHKKKFRLMILYWISTHFEDTFLFFFIFLHQKHTLLFFQKQILLLTNQCLASPQLKSLLQREQCIWSQPKTHKNKKHQTHQNNHLCFSRYQHHIGGISLF